MEAIKKIKDPEIQKVLMDLANEMIHIIEDSDGHWQKTNEIVEGHNDLVKNANETMESLNNVTASVGKLGNQVDSQEKRLQTMETVVGSQYDRQFLNITLLDEKDVKEIETGSIWPMSKCFKIFADMEIKFNKAEISEVTLQTNRRRVNGNLQARKFLKIKFHGTSAAGRIIGQIIKKNQQLKASGREKEIFYMAEIPTSQNVWRLKRICLELKAEGIVSNVMVNDRGITCCFKQEDEEKRFHITNFNDIDQLRKNLNVEDWQIPADQKYNELYWRSKYELKGKRRRTQSQEDEEANDNLKKNRN